MSPNLTTIQRNGQQHLLQHTHSHTARNVGIHQEGVHRLPLPLHSLPPLQHHLFTIQCAGKQQAHVHQSVHPRQHLVVQVEGSVFSFLLLLRHSHHTTLPPIHNHSKHSTLLIQMLQCLLHLLSRFGTHAYSVSIQQAHSLIPIPQRTQHRHHVQVKQHRTQRTSLTKTTLPHMRLGQLATHAHSISRRLVQTPHKPNNTLLHSHLLQQLHQQVQLHVVIGVLVVHHTHVALVLLLQPHGQHLPRCHGLAHGVAPLSKPTKPLVNAAFTQQPSPQLRRHECTGNLQEARQHMHIAIGRKQHPAAALVHRDQN